ncbi:MAG: type I restriction-modification system subunit M [Bdellovibrionota bacterium]|jgi:type I restriction enzyme M protein
MDYGQHSSIVSFIWNIADDVLRDVYVRGKYRDVILPMTVLRRLDAVLEPTKQAVLDMKKKLDDAKIANQEAALQEAAGQAFYNTSQFSLRDLKARATQQKLKSDFEDYLDGFSSNVQDIVENFEFRAQLTKLSKADALGSLVEKFTDSSINLSPNPVLNSDGTVRLPGLDNHAMGTVFEELIRKFNEENNEEAGEHFTPRDVVKLMADMIFLPVAKEIRSGTYLVYDGACGTGGMLTVAEERLKELAKEHKKDVSIHLFGQEINAETYAICKADLLLKGEGVAADNIIGGSDKSTLSNDAFPSKEFDFMLSNPPYGKSWKTDLERMGGKKDIRDARFVIEHNGDPEFNMLTRSSDGQLMFLVNMLSKMKHKTPLGSRIAEVHNGSSLFTGDAGQGESNIRRWILENDWLEAIVALPLNIFYNTGIATYIWILSNKKAPERKGKVQLIDATNWFKALRKNLGKKNCELGAEDIQRINDVFLGFKETEESKIFRNEDFGYWKVTVERPLRLSVSLDEEALSAFEKACADAKEKKLYELIAGVAKNLGAGPHKNYNLFLDEVQEAAKAADIKLSAKAIKLIQTSLAVKDETAEPVIKKIHKAGKAEPNPLEGRFGIKIAGKDTVVEYEPDSDLRDTEQVPLLEEGGIEAFIKREVLPHVPDAWVDIDGKKIGYEINFNRYFYKPQKLRTLEEIKADIFALERETEGLLQQIVGEASAS